MAVTQRSHSMETKDGITVADIISYRVTITFGLVLQSQFKRR